MVRALIRVEAWSGLKLPVMALTMLGVQILLDL